MSRFAVLIGRDELAAIEAHPDRPDVSLMRLRHGQDFIALNSPSIGDLADDSSEEEALVRFFGSRRAITILHTLDQHDALPDLQRGIRLRDESEDYEPVAMALCNRVLVEPARLVLATLKDMCYVGPIRQTPPRHYTALRFRDGTRWANGLAAWDVLSDCSAEQLAEINRWMSGEDRLASGYRVMRRQYRELDNEGRLIGLMLSPRAFDELESIAEELQALPVRVDLKLLDEASGTLLDPEDVGEGIVQILPVVVAALANPRCFLVVEQPELHVHPRMQVALGDLLVARMNGARRAQNDVAEASDSAHFSSSCLIETHSEHLLLRLLRRIRQQTEKSLPPDAEGLKPGDLSVLYVRPGASGSQVVRLRVSDEGEFFDEWPDGFFDERGKELFE